MISKPNNKINIFSPVEEDRMMKEWVKEMSIKANIAIIWGKS